MDELYLLMIEANNILERSEIILEKLDEGGDMTNKKLVDKVKEREKKTDEKNDKFNKTLMEYKERVKLLETCTRQITYKLRDEENLINQIKSLVKCNPKILHEVNVSDYCTQAHYVFEDMDKKKDGPSYKSTEFQLQGHEYAFYLTYSAFELIIEVMIRPGKSNNELSDLKQMNLTVNDFDGNMKMEKPFVFQIGIYSTKNPMYKNEKGLQMNMVVIPPSQLAITDYDRPINSLLSYDCLNLTLSIV